MNKLNPIPVELAHYLKRLFHSLKKTDVILTSLDLSYLNRKDPPCLTILVIYKILTACSLW